MELTHDQVKRMTFDEYFAFKSTHLVHPVTHRPYKKGAPAWFTREGQYAIYRAIVDGEFD